MRENGTPVDCYFYLENKPRQRDDYSHSIGVAFCTLELIQAVVFNAMTKSFYFDIVRLEINV